MVGRHGNKSLLEGLVTGHYCGKEWEQETCMVTRSENFEFSH